jgi:hypothetical protein
MTLDEFLKKNHIQEMRARLGLQSAYSINMAGDGPLDPARLAQCVTPEQQTRYRIEVLKQAVAAMADLIRQTQADLHTVQP